VNPVLGNAYHCDKVSFLVEKMQCDGDGYCNAPIYAPVPAAVLCELLGFVAWHSGYLLAKDLDYDLDACGIYLHDHARTCKYGHIRS